MDPHRSLEPGRTGAVTKEVSEVPSHDEHFCVDGGDNNNCHDTTIDPERPVHPSERSLLIGSTMLELLMKGNKPARNTKTRAGSPANALGGE